MDEERAVDQLRRPMAAVPRHRHAGHRVRVERRDRCELPLGGEVRARRDRRLDRRRDLGVERAAGDRARVCVPAAQLALRELTERDRIVGHQAVVVQHGLALAEHRDGVRHSLGREQSLAGQRRGFFAELHQLRFRAGERFDETPRCGERCHDAEGEPRERLPTRVFVSERHRCPGMLVRNAVEPKAVPLSARGLASPDLSLAVCPPGLSAAG